MNRRRSLIGTILNIPDNYLKINAYARSCSSMFVDVVVPEEFIIDTKSLINQCSLNQLFYTTGAYIPTPIKLKIIGSTEKISNFNLWMCRRTGLETIDGELDFSAVTSFDRPFLYCSALKNITIKPESIHTDFDISSTAALTADSINSIVGGLASGEAHTLKLNAKQPITQEQVNTISAKGWTLSGGFITEEAIK